MVLDIAQLGCSRADIAQALKAEGVDVGTHYQNLHLLPMYQQKIAYGKHGFPWSAEFSRPTVTYAKGICPVAEGLNDASYMGFGMCVYDLSNDDIDLIVAAFRKVWAHLVSE